MEREARAIADALDRAAAGWIGLKGPKGSGRRELLRRCLAGRDAVVLRGAPMGQAELAEHLRAELRHRFGELPRPLGPGVLPDPGPAPGWRTLLLGLADRSAAGGRPVVLALDGWEELVAARRRLPKELAEALDRARRRGGAFRVILTMELDPDHTDGLDVLGEALAVVSLDALPLRAAGRAQGGRSPRDAFLRWACFGGERAHLPPETGVGGQAPTWEKAVVQRVLDPGGDLYDHPLERLRQRFQRPSRYGSLVRALGHGPMDWSELRTATPGLDRGGQMAPYLRRLEEEGLVVAEQPLGAPPDSRRRRYRLADPFWAFWMACVLPVTSRLVREDPWEVWREAVRPRLDGHLGRWLPLAVREWFEGHADERLPATAREVGGLWGGEADFPVVAWLTNGQVCYVDAVWRDDPAGVEVYSDLRARMERTRYGIGREARAPVVVLAGPAEEELRRRVAADPLAVLLSVEELMGQDGF